MQELREINPSHLFLIDGVGAILSAISLGAVLVLFEEFFGMPRTTLYVLAIFPCLFAIYDFYCLKIKSVNLFAFLKWIALMNLFYCVLSIAAMLFHYNELTIYGLIYFIVEIIIVFSLSIIEYRVSING